MALEKELIYPSKGYFENFAEEKAFRKYNTGHYSATSWGSLEVAPIKDDGTAVNGVGIDPDIFELLNSLNEVEFLYTKGMSCSGSLKDHGQYLCFLNDFGIDRSGFQGYIMLRVDTRDKRFPTFKRGLEQLCKAELNIASSRDPDDDYQRQQGIRNMALQVRVPEYVLDKQHHQHKTYMTEAWNTIHKLVKIFYQPTIVEKIKAKSIEKRKWGYDAIKELIRRR